jgi:Flp pilus assembly protein TadB
MHFVILMLVALLLAAAILLVIGLRSVESSTRSENLDHAIDEADRSLRRIAVLRDLRKTRRARDASDIRRADDYLSELNSEISEYEGDRR